MRPNGIFYRFVEPADDFFDFSTDILRELVEAGISGDDLVVAFEQRKNAMTQALTNAMRGDDAKLMSRKELEAEIGL